MPQPRPRVLLISDLRSCPVGANLVTEHTIEAIRSSLEQGRAVPGITVGLVNKSRYYIVDGHARVEAHRRAELEEVGVAEVIDLESESEVMIEHVRRNLHSPLNPIKVAAITQRLADAGMQDPVRVIGLSPVMGTAVNVIKRWPADIVSRLSEVLETGASKFSDVYALPHFFAAFEELTEKVYRADKNAEERLRDVTYHIAKYLESVGEEGGFTLPGPDQIRMIMSVRRQKMVEQVQGMIQGQGPGQAAGSQPGHVKKEQTWLQAADGRAGDMKPLIMPDRNKSMIECTHCGRPQIVDLKTGHACKIESVAGDMIDVIREGDGRRSYALSTKAVEFLGFDRPVEEISHARYAVMATDKKSEVEQAIKSARPRARFVIIISEFPA